MAPQYRPVTSFSVSITPVCIASLGTHCHSTTRHHVQLSFNCLHCLAMGPSGHNTPLRIKHSQFQTSDGQEPDKFPRPPPAPPPPPPPHTHPFRFSLRQRPIGCNEKNKCFVPQLCTHSVLRQKNAELCSNCPNFKE